MDNRCIGVFDSGLGGLTAVRELVHELPQENIVYFGDTGRVPYGTRSAETIIKYVRQDINFLRQFDVKLVLAACGTASSAALPAIQGEYDLPIFGVVEPAVAEAVRVCHTGKIGIIGTGGTINSGAYQTEVARINRDLKTVAVACPMFVPLVENGYTDCEVARLIAEEYLEPIKRFGADTVILGCTHYPLLKGVISSIMGSGVSLIDTGAQAARQVASFLRQNGLTGNEGGSVRYFVSDSVDHFASLGGMFLETTIHSRVEKINIEDY